MKTKSITGKYSAPRGIPLRKAQKSRRPPNLKPEQNRQAKKGRKPPNLQTMRQITRSGGRARKTTADMQP